MNIIISLFPGATKGARQEVNIIISLFPGATKGARQEVNISHYSRGLLQAQGRR